MGTFQSLHVEDYGALANKTGFTPEQISNLHRRFRQLSQNKPTLRREDFSAISDLALNPICSQIIEAFFDERNFHSGASGAVDEITFEDFLVVLSHFRPPKADLTGEEKQELRDEKLRFLFNMYDTDNDGTITLDEYRRVVEELLSYSGTLESDTAESLVDAAMKEVASLSVGHMGADETCEGITFEQFVKIFKDLEIETRMYVRFLHMDPTPLCR